MYSINNDWHKLLKEEFNKDYFINLTKFLDNEYLNKTIFPDKSLIFNALNLCPYENTKVLILGQDPYHEIGQAHGLAFSVNKGVKLPPSLKNIYKELSNDLNISVPTSGDLSPWALQGVLLLNTVLTVEQSKANSHANKGWEVFTDKIIELLNKKDKPMVFILWGNKAIDKKKYITNPKHLIITSAHPSPLSAYHGFFGSKPFSKTNEFLLSNNIKPINWSF